MEPLDYEISEEYLEKLEYLNSCERDLNYCPVQSSVMNIFEQFL